MSATLGTETQLETLPPLDAPKSEDAVPSAPTTSHANVLPIESKEEAAHAQTKPARTTNQLEAAFSSTQREHVAQLKAQLPDIVEKTGESKLWNVDLTAADDKRVDVVLNKFIVAREGNVEAAIEQLVNTLKWRKDFDAASTLTESFPEEIFGKAGYTAGFAKNGAVIAYSTYGAVETDVLFGDSDRFIRWRVGLMERALAKLDFTTADQVLLIGDYGGAKPTAASKATAKELSKMFAAHYPELLYRHLFLNIPTWMTWVANIFRPLLPGKTFAKFEFIGTSPEAHKHAIQAYVALDQLPKRYGGTLSDDQVDA